MALELDLVYEAGAIEAWLKKITPEALTRMMEQAVQTAAATIADIVKQEYQKTEEMRTQGTLQTYLQGKSEGSTPARNTYSGKSMVRTGQLANSVVVTREGGSAISYLVHIKQGAHTEGDPADALKQLGMIAHQLEAATPVIIVMTARMMAYLQLLQRGEAGKGPKTGRKAPDLKLNQVILVVPRGRGVWARAIARLGELEKPVGAVWEKHFR
jgi:hypothetical protein